MKLKNFVKLFSVMAIFVLGCCFTNVSAKKYMFGDMVVADCTFVEEPGLGGKILIVKNINKSADELGCLEMIGESINKKCQTEKIDLRAVLTPDLNFRLSNPAKETPDQLFISPNQGCTDLEVRYWPLEAMGLTRREGNRSIKNVFLRPAKGNSAIPVMPEEILFDKQSGKFVHKDVERCIAEREAEKRREEAEKRQEETEKRQEETERRKEKTEEKTRRQTPREQEIEDLTKRKANLKYQLTGARKRLVSYQEEIVRYRRSEREKGRLLQGTRDALENEAKTQRQIIDLEAAIERTEEKLAALEV